jgi:hypothetical protein
LININVIPFLTILLKHLEKSFDFSESIEKSSK